MIIYRLYGDDIRKGWVLIDSKGAREDIDQLIERMDREIYRGYMIIEHDILKNMDTPIFYDYFEAQRLRKSR